MANHQKALITGAITGVVTGAIASQLNCRNIMVPVAAGIAATALCYLIK